MLEELKSNELGLSSEQRKELIWAFLAARDEVRDRESNELWKVLAESPEETDLQALVYRFLPVDDHVAAEVYRKTENPEWRRAILQMVWDEDVTERSVERYGRYGLHNETLDLAIKDANGVCRLLAYATLRLGHSSFADRRDRSRQWQDLQRAARSDIYALSGLAKNAALTPEELRWVETSANALVGSLKDKSNLWVHLGGDEGYSTSEVGLLHQIRQDVERRITELRFEKQLGKIKPLVDANRPTSGQEFEGTHDEKLDYLTLVSLSTSTFGLKQVFAVTGPALIAFALTYLFFHNGAIALFAVLSWSWLSGKIWLRSTNRVAPWLDPDEYIARVRKYWSERSEPRKPPLIQDRPAEELEREAKMRERRADLDEWAR